MPRGVEYIIGELKNAGYEAFIVGGCVRDRLLNRIPSDWDMCTSALPHQIKQVFEGKLPQKDIGIAHGTVTLFPEDGPVEVTTFRSDGKYSDHRRPDQVVLGVSLREDLARRDFTINAMAVDEQGNLVDYFGGRQDLDQKIIRCVGDPGKRFQEDALRILRALRFASQLNFSIEPATLQAARKCSYLLCKVSKERIFTELDKLLLGQGAGAVLAESGDILAKVIPQIEPCIQFDLRSPMHHLDLWKHTAAAVGCAEPVRNVRWALLLHDLAKPECFVVDEKGVGHAPDHGNVGSRIAMQVLRDLRAPAKMIEQVRLLVKFHDNPAVAKDVSVRRWMARLGTAQLEELILMKRADLAAHADRPEVRRRQRQLEKFAQLETEIKAQNPCVSLSAMAVNGRDLIRAGACKSGPQTGWMLHQLLYAIINGTVENKKQTLINFAKNELQEKPVQK